MDKRWRFHPHDAARIASLERSAGVPAVLDLDYRPYQWASPEEARAVYGAAAALSDATRPGLASRTGRAVAVACGRLSRAAGRAPG